MAAGIVFMWIWSRREKQLHGCFHDHSLRCVSSRVYLPHGVGQDLDDLLVRRRHDALTVDLDDAVTNSDAASLGNAASHQAADLHDLK